MSVKEVIEKEERDKGNLYDIHLYLEGLFWRAYEWSAYLSRNFPTELSDKQKLKPLIKSNKQIKDNVVYVGLQMASFEKYFPNVIGNDDIVDIGDKHIVMHCENFFDSLDFSEYKKILNEWKNSVSKSNGETIIKENIIKNDIGNLISEIVSYPIERKNLIENLQFLTHIKEMCLTIKQ